LYLQGLTVDLAVGFPWPRPVAGWNAGWIVARRKDLFRPPDADSTPENGSQDGTRFHGDGAGALGLAERLRCQGSHFWSVAGHATEESAIGTKRLAESR
jgi:hypothetical protein